MGVVYVMGALFALAVMVGAMTQYVCSRYELVRPREMTSR